MIYETKIENILDHLDAHFKQGLEKYIEDELSKRAAPIIKAVAKKMASDLQGRIRYTRQSGGLNYGEMQIQIIINGVPLDERTQDTGASEAGTVQR